MRKLMLALTALVCLSAPVQAASVLIGSSPPTQPSVVPVVANAGNSGPYVAGGAPAPVDNAIVTTCGCSNLSSATITISSGAFTGDVLNFVPQGGITGVFSSNVLTLSGAANVATYTSAMRSVTYSSSNADPTNSGANPTRTITWQTVNGANNSNTPTSLINLSLPPATPTIANVGNTVTYTAGGSAQVVDGLVAASCSCSNLTGATISISAGLLGGDSLNFTNVFSVTGTYNGSTGVLTLTGTDTVAHYNTAMQSITYSSSIGDPTNAGADSTRTVNWVVANTTVNSAAGNNSTVNVQNNAQPTLSSIGNTVNYTSGGSATVIDNAVIVACTCANLSGATLTIQPGTGGNGGFLAGDQLAATTTGTSISAAYNATTGVLTLSNSDTKANYQTVMRTIAYSSTAGDATANGNNPTRTITWVANNITVSSNPVSTFVDTFASGQPVWAMTGATVAVNGQTNQCWISGSGITTLSACLNVTRASTETCYNTTGPAFVTFASSNVGCAVGNGLAQWGVYTNYIPNSNDVSQGTWAQYATGGAGNTITVTANSATDPTNVTTQAAKVTIVRTTTGNYAAAIANQINAPVGTYSGGIWLKADGGGDVGKVVQLGFFGPGANFTLNNITLTATWTNYTLPQSYTLTSPCTSASTNCQFQVGYTNQAGSGPAVGIASVNFDVWGAEFNQGSTVYPTIPTAGAAVASTFDNITAVSGSAMENALHGPASSVIMVTAGGTQSVASTLVDSNGTTLLGETAANALTSAVGSSATTANTSTWTGVTTSGYARDGSGRTFALNKGALVKDSQSTTIGTPIHFGSTLGNVNPFNGYIQTINVFNTRVPDGTIGVSGGTKYYFAAAGSDANPCTLASPCQSITKANTINFTTNDQLNFNGGDTFIGCLTLNGASNWSASRTNPATIQSYGTGQATLTPNCTATAAKIGAINMISADGFIISNLHFVDDVAGNANRAISISNADNNNAHGTYTIQNNLFNGFHSGSASGNDFGADIFIDTSVNGGIKFIDHGTILNNTAAGATNASTDGPFLTGYNFGIYTQQFDMIQGNLCFNLGGNGAGVAGEEGSCILMQGTAGPGTPQAGPPTGTPGAIAQFNVVHDDGLNRGSCGDFAAIWFNGGSDNGIIRMNESYHNIKQNAGCDGVSWDIDAGTGKANTNSLVERNYSHSNWGPCVFIFGGNPNSTIRWNICDGDSNGFNNTVFAWTNAGQGVSYVYNNIFVGSATAGIPITATGCPAAGSLFANNIIRVDQTANGLANYMYLQNQGTGGACTVGAGGVTFANNDWWQVVGGNPFGRNGNSTSTTTFAAFETLFGETNGQNVSPQWQGAVLQNTICNSTVGSPGPQANGCPSQFNLLAGSPLAAPAGATLSSAPFNLPTNNGGGPLNPSHGQGTLSYYGDALPCAAGGYPIGVDCGTAAVASLSYNFTTGTLPAGVTMTGGAGASYYTSANVLHPGNVANNPRFDHNPANGAALGILVEPALSNFWASSNPTGGNTYTADADHAQLSTFINVGGAPGNAPQTNTGWVGVWGHMAGGNHTGPDNVANSAGTFTEDNCTYLTSDSATPNPTPGCGDGVNHGDGGHASANAVQPGANTPNAFASNGTWVVSSFVRRSSGNRSVDMYPSDPAGSGECFLVVDLGSGAFVTQANNNSAWTCDQPVIQPVNLSGNSWFHIAERAVTNSQIIRVNFTDVLSGTPGQPSTYVDTFTGDNSSGYNIYGLMIQPYRAPTCTPQVAGAVPCVANSYIANTNVHTAPVTTSADQVTFNIPAGINFLTYTFDDNSTQKVAVTAGVTGYSIPTNLNRPWIKTVVGSAS